MFINLLIAFGAGLISFLSPCVLPLIPGYISYISGESLGDIIEKQRKIVLKTILFTSGFSLVFISLLHKWKPIKPALPVINIFILIF